MPSGPPSNRDPTDAASLGDRSTYSLKDLEHVPERIGSYRILGRIGEGGMGVVYLAEQEEPVHRRVALKIIKLGMDTKEVIGRFESERQALALMNHPNIAMVYDAGATEEGRPYFVMEHVEGVPITEYCDRQRLGNRERLELFVHVCEAVHHAHQKGVIHRDIKPSNVLVALQDGVPVPKVIDFGVAKATSHRLTERTVFTEQGQLVGTPEYMSPEQAEMTGQNVDTTTDVYSLGVMLYELLTGTLPFDPSVLRSAGYEGIQRIIREDEAPPPSTRLKKLGDTGTEVARLRHTDLPALRRQLHGELDWITMRAIEKDRTHRYPSASELAADVGRFLRTEPVMARPHSAVYHFRKLVLRHKAPFVFAGILVGVLLGFGLWMSILYGRAVRAERSAMVEARTSAQVSEFLEGLFQVSDPTEAMGDTLTAIEILERGSRRIDEELAGQPEVQATLLISIGKVYQGMGLYEESLAKMEKALALRRDVLGPEHVLVAEALFRVGDLLWDNGDLDGAEARLRESLAMRRKLLGEENEEVARSMDYLGSLLGDKGDNNGAEAMLRASMAMFQRITGEESADVAMSMSNLAWVLQGKGDYEEAEALYRKSLALRRRLFGDQHPDVARDLNGLAYVLQAKGDYEGAEALFRESLALYRRILGEEHPYVATIVINLAKVYMANGDYEKAEALSREALSIRRKFLGEEHPRVAMALYNLATVLEEKGEFPKAEALFRRALSMCRKLDGGESRTTALVLSGLGATLASEGNPAAGEPLLREAHSVLERNFPESHADVAVATGRLGECLVSLGRYGEAESLLVQAYLTVRDIKGSNPRATEDARRRLLNLYDAWGKPERGAAYRAVARN